MVQCVWQYEYIHNYFLIIHHAPTIQRHSWSIWTLYPITHTSMAGCPCNASKNAASFQCPSGYRCSSSAYHGLSTEVIMQPALGRLQAICVACDSGQYCPQGTYLLVRPLSGFCLNDSRKEANTSLTNIAICIQNERDRSSLDCPVGKYCPSPAEQYICPAGSYCVARTTAPMTCDYNYLISKSPYTSKEHEGLYI